MKVRVYNSFHNTECNLELSPGQRLSPSQDAKVNGLCPSGCQCGETRLEKGFLIWDFSENGEMFRRWVLQDE